MLRRAAVLLFVGAAWLACVGDDPAGPSSAPKTSERLGPCATDRDCNDGLFCHPTDKVCLLTGEEAPGDAGGSPLDATANANDAGADVEVRDCTLPPAAGIPCPNTSCPPGVNQTCCIAKASGSRSCDPGCSSDFGRPFECDTQQFCRNNTICCALTGATKTPTACNTRVELKGTYCLQTCPGPMRLCRSATDCGDAGRSCVLTEVELAPGVVSVWGLCAN